MEFLLKSKQIKVLIFIVLCFFIYICVAKSYIIQTIHLLTLNNILRVKVKVKTARNWVKMAFSYQYFVIFPRVWCKMV